jgi:hypothetical protein
MTKNIKKTSLVAKEPCAGLSIFFKCTITSLFTGGTFYQYQEVPDYFRQVKVPGTAAY